MGATGAIHPGLLRAFTGSQLFPTLPPVPSNLSLPKQGQLCSCCLVSLLAPQPFDMAPGTLETAWAVRNARASAALKASMIIAQAVAWPVRGLTTASTATRVGPVHDA